MLLAIGIGPIEMLHLRLQAHPSLKLTRTEAHSIPILEFVQRHVLLDKIEDESPTPPPAF